MPGYLGCRTLPPVGIAEVRPLINWVYFFNLWRVRRGTPEAEAVQREAEQLLDRLEAAGHTLAAQVAFYPANGTADALLFHLDGEDLRIPTPRQQETEKSGEPLLSLCDFVAPAPLADHLGAFAVTLSPALVGELEAAKAGGDDYRSLLLQSVCDRLAEATAEWLHREVRRNLWGYAPDEDLPLADLARAAYRGIRPAVGYPALPDQQQIFRVARLLDFTKIGLQLTENGAMYPQSSVCGLLFSNPHSRYFAVKKELK